MSNNITSIWHLFDGKFVHIFQITKGDLREYYTDGVIVATKKVNSDGTVKDSK